MRREGLSTKSKLHDAQAQLQAERAESSKALRQAQGKMQGAKREREQALAEVSTAEQRCESLEREVARVRSLPRFCVTMTSFDK